MSIKYRPEIDGLRAIAVLSVIFYHAEYDLKYFKLLAGGYFGVDVFFVISGYLITSIILTELSKGSFSFKRFYERRIRRLMPTLMFVMVASAPFAWYLLLPANLKSYSGSILSSLGFSSNIWFWNEDSYWAGPSALKPFLHTWSLSIEEQFYIAFPVSLLIIQKIKPRWIFSVLALATGFSFVLALVLSHRHADFSFFMLPTRAWEMLGGALLAKLELDRGRPSPKKHDSFFVIIGLVAILLSLLWFDQSVSHPGFVTLLPVLGTMLIIWFARQEQVVTTWLSSRYLLIPGLLSYSLYLWHFPVFAFSKIWLGELNNWQKTGLIVVVVLLSSASYYLIEKPFRNKYVVKNRFFYPTIGLMFATLLIFNIRSFQTDGIWGRFSGWQLRFLGEDRSVGSDFSKYVTTRYNQEVAGKSFAEPKVKPRVLLIGDSFSQDFFNILFEAGLLNDVDLVARYLPAICKNVPADLGRELDENIKAADKAKCQDMPRIGDARMNAVILQTDAVILASSWDNFTASQLERTKKIVNSLGVKNVLVVGRKQFPTISSSDLMWLDLSTIKSMKMKVDPYGFQVNAEMARNNKEDFLDVHEAVCGSGNECPVATSNGYLLSYDGSHFSREGAIFMSEILKTHKNFQAFWYKLQEGRN